MYEITRLYEIRSVEEGVQGRQLCIIFCNIKDGIRSCLLLLNLINVISVKLK